MASHWQQAQRITVAANGGTAVFTVTPNMPLERMTVWAVSGARTLVNTSFQPRLNGVNYGAAVPVVGAPAADVVYRSGGAATENDMLPYYSADSRQRYNYDPLVLDVRITNNDAVSAVDVTMYAVAIVHQG